MRSRPHFLLSLVLALFIGVSVHGQSAPTPAHPAPSPTLPVEYPDSTSGLERLAKDILKAQSQNDGARADALLNSLVLPNAREWYERVFGKTASVAGNYYEKAHQTVAPHLAHAFLDITSHNLFQVQAHRFEDSCDDNAADNTYGILLSRREPVPLYELRFLKGNNFFRIFPLAYVDGAFRFLLPPDFQPTAPPTADKKGAEEEKPTESEGPPPIPRIRMGGSVQASKLVHRVQPVYPGVAREEHLQGTVTLHVIIGKDGSIREIRSIHGACSLARSSAEAVRQWRYSPVLLNGNPVEVDTEISVVFSLTQ
jgi:TonB family protein